MRSDKTRARLLFVGLHNYDFLVKKSFTHLKTPANVYQSLQEAFYQRAKVPHSVYTQEEILNVLVQV